MAQYLIAYAGTAVVFLALDALWLGVVAVSFYKEQLGDLLADRVKFGYAAGFYLIYCIGIVIFAVAPALKTGQWTDAALYGALFGFFCYATYDMTNLATIRGWPLPMSLVDMAWGSALTGTAAVAGYFTATLVPGGVGS
ncbi:MAG: DUF2177 family protein [Pseudomonadota bacterium]